MYVSLKVKMAMLVDNIRDTLVMYVEVQRKVRNVRYNGDILLMYFNWYNGDMLLMYFNWYNGDILVMYFDWYIGDILVMYFDWYIGRQI